MVNYIVTNESITVLINNRPEIIDSTHQNFKAVEEGLKSGMSESQILDLMNIGKAVEKFAAPTNGKVKVKDGSIFYNGKEVHSALSRRILSLMENGFDITPFTNFMENLYQNPSKSAVDELYGFLEACTLPITPDGYFLAYKKVNANYTDVYTGTIDNSIGTKVSMPRYEVDEDSNRTCSTGLHVASFSYMSHYSGARTVICKVHPKDVVAVPKDYNNAKMRVCEYEVVNEVENLKEEITDNVISDDEVYSEEYTEQMNNEDYDVPSYNTCSELLEAINIMDLNSCRKEYKNISNAKNYLDSITNSTSFWKKALIDILHAEYGFDDCPDEDSKISEESFYSEPRTEKMKFSKALEAYLKDFDDVKWLKLVSLLEGKYSCYISGFINTSYKLKDYNVVIKKLKSLAKKGTFKKKELLRDLGI